MKTCALGALAQIGAAADTHIWDAHRGCSALAGALLVAQGLVGRAARNRIATRVGSEFATRASAEPRGTVPPAVFARALLRELAVDAGEPRGLGHDVIFAAYALRAIEVFGIDPWPSLLDGP